MTGNELVAFRERKDWHALCLWHEGQGADAKDV